MRTQLGIICILLAFLCSAPSFGQEEEIKKATEKKINEGIGRLLGGKKKKQTTLKQETKKEPAKEAAEQNKQAGTPEEKEEAPLLNWSKFDFVPGDQVLFEDNLQDEENGEFPSRWDLYRGNIEVAEFGGENVIMFRDGAPAIIPYLENPQEDYLPEIFTLELDLYYPGDGRFEVILFDRKNQKSGSPTGYTGLSIDDREMRFATSASAYPTANLEEKRWIHVSIAYTKGKLKAYMDDTRLINIPRIDFDPSGITLYTYHASNENLFYVKNIRIAEGGVKYYDRVMEDGKIIVNGIRFDVGKSTLKPESMGAINEIFDLMRENADIKFSVEGHTDSQGDEAFNLKLSEERARTVMNTLVKMGISADRLSHKGWGETKPISNNASPEDMANNRRVEFVKM